MNEFVPPLGPRIVVRDVRFPEQIGVYAVWADGDERPLYVGVAATQTIAKRWLRQHLYPRAGGSALRRTLGLSLGLVAEKLRRPARYYPPKVEDAITRYLQGCTVEFWPAVSAQAARTLEKSLIRQLLPRLNVRR